MSVASEISEGRDPSLPVGSVWRAPTLTRGILQTHGFRIEKCCCGGSDESRAKIEEAAKALGDCLLSGLHRDVQEDDIKKITALLDVGADPNARSDSEFTPLHGAAAGGHPEAIAALLERAETRRK